MEFFDIRKLYIAGKYLDMTNDWRKVFPLIDSVGIFCRCCCFPVPEMACRYVVLHF